MLEELSSDEGISLRVPEFEVAAGDEIQDCYFFDVPDLAGGEDLWIDRLATAINPGSHHMNIFRVRTVVDLDPYGGEPTTIGAVDGEPIEATVLRGKNAQGECFRSSNWADWPLLTNSQESSIDDPVSDWRLPEGVAVRLEPGERLMLQTHYVNASTQETPFRGRVGANLYRSQDGDTDELGTLFATQQSIRICQSNPQVSYSGSCRFPQGTIQVAAANGHFHSRGVQFAMYEWDGASTEQPPEADRFYVSERWDDPPMSIYDGGVAIPTGGGVYWTCDFQWRAPAVGCDAVNARDPEMQDDCCYTFGPLVEASEHCNAFVYYWPKADAGDVFCN